MIRRSNGRRPDRSGSLLRIVLIAVAGATIFLGCGSGEEDDGTTTLTVIPKGTTQAYWQSVHAGALMAADELDVQVNWVGPVREDARQEQIQIVQNQVINRVDGIVLAPLDASALRTPVESATEADVPVVIIDSRLNDAEEFITSFVATDNRAGGRLAGEHLGRMIDDSGEVMMLRFTEGSASTANREAGFMEAMEQFDGIEVVSDEQYAGATKAEAQEAASNLILRYTDQSGNLTVDGVFTPNESTTYGMLQALRRNGLAGSITFVGFDASETLVEGLRQDEIDGLVAQDPFRIGYLGARTLVEHLRGEPVPAQVNTEVHWVSRENVEDSTIQRVINPPIDRWLNGN